MIDPAVLQRILTTHKDAQFGYCAMDCQTYFRHVAVLLSEIDLLHRRVAELEAALTPTEEAT